MICARLAHCIHKGATISAGLFNIHAAAPTIIAFCAINSGTAECAAGEGRFDTHMSCSLAGSFKFFRSPHGEMGHMQSIYHLGGPLS